MGYALFRVGMKNLNRQYQGATTEALVRPSEPKAQVRVRPRVLFLNSCVSGGGAGRSLENYLICAAKDIEPHIVVPEYALMGDSFAKYGKVWIVPEFVERIHKSPYKLPKLLNRRWIHLLLNLYVCAVGAKKIISLCKKIQPDVLYCNHMLSKPIGAFVGWWTGVPVIFHARNISMTRFGKIFYTTLSKLSCVKRVVSNSKATADDFIKAVPGKVTVLHNFVDTKKFDYEQRTFALKKEYGLPKDAVIAGFFGRLVKKKGVDVLLEASQKIISKYEKLYVVIVGGNDGGDIDYLKLYRQKVEEAGLSHRILFTGLKEDIRPYLADIDFVVMPSTDPEPFGRILVEAMAYKIPAIATKHGGALEVVEDGETGLLVAPNDAEALAQAIEWLVKHPKECRIMGDNAYLRLLRHFSAQAISLDLTDIIRRATLSVK